MPTFDSTFGSTFQTSSNDVYFTIQNDPSLWLDGGHGNAVFSLDHPDVPQSFWDSVSADGGNIRVYHWDGSTETAVAREVSNVDAVAKTGQVYFDSTDSLANTVNEWRIYAESGETEPTPTDPLGSQSVWSNFNIIAHSGGGSDSSPEQNDFVEYNGASTGNQVGIIGEASDYVGSSTHYQKTNNALGIGGASPRVVSGWVKADSATQDNHHVWHVGGGGTSGRDFSLVYGPDDPRLNGWSAENDLEYTLPTGVGYNDYVLHHHVYDGSTIYVYANGTLINQKTVTLDTWNSTVILGGEIVDENGDSLGLPWDNPFNGLLNQFRIRNGTPTNTADYIATEYENQQNHNSFWTVSSPSEQISGGSGSSVFLNSTGAGEKSVESGSDAIVGLSTTSGGSKATEGGSGSSVVLNSTGDGAKQVEQGSGASILLQAVGAGYRNLDLYAPTFTDENFGSISAFTYTSAKARFKITDENPEAERYDLLYDGEVINVDDIGYFSSIDTYVLESGDLPSKTLPYDSAIDIQLRSVNGQQTGSWSDVVTLYTTPVVPENPSVDSVNPSGYGVSIDFTPSVEQDAYRLRINLASDSSSVSSDLTGPLTQPELSPAEYSDLEPETEYEFRLRPLNFSSFYTDAWVINQDAPVYTTFSTTADYIGGNSTEVLLSSDGSGFKNFEDGSDANIVLSATSGGRKATEDGSGASILIEATGEGKKDVGSGSDSAIIISAVGAGQAGTFIGGGSNATMLIDTTGEGFKETSDGSSASVLIEGIGDGQKGILEGSESGVLISSEGSGDKTIQSGSNATVLVASDGQGNKQILSGAQAEVIIQAFGSGIVSQKVEIAKINMKLEQAGIKGIFEV